MSKFLEIEFSEKQLVKLAGMAASDGIHINFDEDAAEFVSSMLDKMLVAQEMLDAIEAALRIKDLWTYDDSDYMSKKNEGKALCSMLAKFNEVVAKVKEN